MFERKSFCFRVKTLKRNTVLNISILISVTADLTMHLLSKYIIQNTRLHAQIIPLNTTAGETATDWLVVYAFRVCTLPTRCHALLKIRYYRRRCLPGNGTCTCKCMYNNIIHIYVNACSILRLVTGYLTKIYVIQIISVVKVMLTLLFHFVTLRICNFLPITIVRKNIVFTCSLVFSNTSFFKLRFRVKPLEPLQNSGTRHDHTPYIFKNFGLSIFF